jgi:hypothetical protein
MGTLANITRTDGARNPSGGKIKIKVNWSDYITTWPTLPASPSTDVERTTVADNFVSPTLSPFKEFEFIPATSRLMSKKLGAQNQVEMEGEIFIPNSTEGTTAEAQIQLLYNSNTAVIFYLQNGGVKLMGEDESRPCRLTEANWDSKKINEDGTVSMVVKFECISVVPGGANFSGELTTA